MRVLVAGAGDLGGRVVAALRARGDQADSLSRRPRRDRSHRVADLTDPGTLAPLCGERYDAVLACVAPDGRDRAAYDRVYRDGIRALLDVLAPPARVVFVSSTAVYGGTGGEWVDEGTAPDPPGWNGAALLDAEIALRAARPDLRVLRLSGLYGPGRLGLVARVRAGASFGLRHANRIRVEDAARVALAMLDADQPPPLVIGWDPLESTCRHASLSIL